MRLVPRSIHGRMLMLSAIATIVALAIAGVAILGVLERFAIRGLDQRLDAELSLLASVVTAKGTIDRARLEQARPALESERGWRWRVAAPGEIAASVDFPKLDPGPPRRDMPRVHKQPDDRAQPAEGHDRHGMPLHARTLKITSAAGPVTLTVAAPWRLVSQPIRAALLPLMAILVILGLTLGAAAMIQLRIGLRPLRRLRDDVAAIRAGKSRTLDDDQPDELQPLVHELNALVRDTASALDTARASAANLAHALKTPVAMLALELRGDPTLTGQVDRIYTTIRHHLARARAGIADTRATTLLGPAIDDLVATISRLHGDRALTIVTEVPVELALAVDAADLDEMLGNLIDNAARHAATRITICAQAIGVVVRIAVVDDGPGIAIKDRAQATTPGVRLDQRTEGDGFGLAIVRDLAALHGGRLILDEAATGGLSATVELPAR